MPILGAGDKSSLPGKNYQAVYLGPKRLQAGGDMWVFVDRESGEVIDVVGGK